MGDKGHIPPAQTYEVGTVLWWKGKEITVVEGYACDDCVFNIGGCQRPYGYGVCTGGLRADGKNIHYEHKKKKSKGNRQELFGKSGRRRKAKLRRTHTRGRDD